MVFSISLVENPLYFITTMSVLPLTDFLVGTGILSDFGTRMRVLRTVIEETGVRHSGRNDLKN